MNRFRNIVAQAILATLLFALAHPAARANPCATERFVLDDEVAKDAKTKLVWKRCSHGLEWLDRDGCGGKIEGLPLNAAHDLARKAGGGWRLPTADELLTLVVRGCGEPAIDRDIFPDVPLDPGGEGSLYWTSTPAGMLNMTITVDFRDGTYDMHSPGLFYFVRLVRTAE